MKFSCIIWLFVSVFLVSLFPCFPCAPLYCFCYTLFSCFYFLFFSVGLLSCLFRCPVVFFFCYPVYLLSCCLVVLGYLFFCCVFYFTVFLESCFFLAPFVLLSCFHFLLFSCWPTLTLFSSLPVFLLSDPRRTELRCFLSKSLPVKVTWSRFLSPGYRFLLPCMGDSFLRVM